MSAPLSTLTYEVTGRIARITLDRPERGNGITREMPRELAACVERANLDPDVHVIALAGQRQGLLRRLRPRRERRAQRRPPPRRWPTRRPARRSIRPCWRANHVPGATWDPTIDYAMMSRNVRGFMSPLSLRQARRLQGARLLRRGRHRHGALLGPARHRRHRQDRVPARPRLGRSDDGGVGVTASESRRPSVSSSRATA